MIQIITKDTYMYKDKLTNKEVVISNFNEYQSFDLYDINIVNLASDSLWCSDSSTGEYLNDRSDLSTIKNAINTCNTKVIIFFPQNHYFRYNYSIYSKTYKKISQLKSLKETVGNFISKYVYAPLPNFNYEKGITKFEGIVYKSDFYFDEKEGIILCEKSKKINTMSLTDRIVITTLNIFGTPVNKEIEKKLFSFLNKIGFFEPAESIPKWIENVNFYDDCIYKEEIDKCNEEIEKIKEIINVNKEKLTDNLKYKSILYSSGSFLSKQINKMLIEMFKLDSNFIDIYEEDFNFKYEDVTFIVETKGLNNEVSGQNVSDAYNHLVIYDDNLENKGIIEETKCLFFVANERNKEPHNRCRIKERQITIAKRNKTLIIETIAFYKLFEDYKKGKISIEQISSMFKNNVGLLMYESDD